jgi:hypothetical protein
MVYTDKLNISEKTEILQFVPNQLEYLTKTKKIEYKDKNIKTAYLIDIIHKFITRRFFTNKTEINLSSEILRKCYGTFYNYYISYLIDNKIVDKKSNYFAGLKCNTYSLNPIYLKGDKGDLIRWKNDDKILLKKWRRNMLTTEVEKLNDVKKINETVKRKLIDDLFHVEVDFKKASTCLKNLFDEGVIDDIGYWKNQLSIESIEDGSIFYVEDSYGRFHTNYTVLKKVIRDEHITIDGQEVEEIDIKNSQPLFLSILMKEEGFDKDHPEEYERYYKSVKSGNIYEEYMEVSGWERKVCKKAMYKILFANNSLKGKNARINKHFKSIYPEVWNWLKLVKDSAGDHRVIAHSLQRKESNLIFDHICYKIYRDMPEVKIFTVHDSIFFQKKHHDRVRDVFYNHIDALFA